MTRDCRMTWHLANIASPIVPRPYQVTLLLIVKPARLHFARTALHVCERGVLSEFRAARTCASYWFDNPSEGVLRSVPF